MPRGGKRLGAGKPKGHRSKNTLDKIAARELTRQLVTQHIGPMVEAQIAHSKGIKYLVGRLKSGGKWERVTQDKLQAMLDGQDDGSIVLEVWDKDPSVQAFTDLMNRAIDKPAEQEQAVAVSGELVIRWKK
jgi:hypothetical protein